MVRDLKEAAVPSPVIDLPGTLGRDDCPAAAVDASVRLGDTRALRGVTAHSPPIGVGI